MAYESTFFPVLPDGWEDTRATLHAYALAVEAIPRAYADAHPRWWHVSLEVTGGGLATDAVPLPGGGSLTLVVDLAGGQVILTTAGGHRERFDMGVGLTGTEMGDAVIAAARRHGLEGQYDRARFENDEARAFDLDVSASMMAIFRNVAAVFEAHRKEIGGEVGPIQLWPHGFDLAFEWFGTRVETYEENGEVTEQPSQLNLGFYPGGEPYFYSNPWPFEQDELLSQQLPHGARWHTEGWQGSMLPYANVAGDPDGASKLAEYARAVFELAAPTLTA